ncbi:MAG: translation elongation factor Ts [Candidatus Obscuribacterales bacterium]|nr:translation elongation factor Ts [Candidatus Obscuribacterales bacterium]
MTTEISASQVKQLREQTGAGMMECKNALKEANGDMEKAVEWLRQKGLAAAAKKSSRAASEGLVVGKVSDDGKRAVLVEVNCETDFVARNEQFQAFTAELADIALKNKSQTAEDLLKLTHNGKTVSDILSDKIATIGENMVLRRVAYIELAGTGLIGLYVHALGGKMGALVALESNKDLPPAELSPVARDVAMHIVSAKPQYIDRNEIPSEVIEEERRIESGKEDLAKKPADIREKIVTGRVDKIFAERCLMEQDFVKDPSQKIAQVLKLSDKGAELKPKSFALFILGEGADKAENN